MSRVLGPVLVVSATRAEAAHVPDGLPVVVTGMGKVAAAVATARALASYDDLAGLTVVNIGSAGALRPGLTGVLEPGVVLNHDLSADVVRMFGDDPHERLEVGPSDVVLATGDVFVSDPVVRNALAERAHLVDMEGYAVAWACRQAGVPVQLVKHVSDSADEGAMEWASLVGASAVALGDWLGDWLRDRA